MSDEADIIISLGAKIGVGDASIDKVAQFVNHFMPGAVEQINLQFSPRQLIKPDRVTEPLPTDKRQLSSYRTRLGTTLEYALSTCLDKAIERLFGAELRLTFAVAHDYPDFYVRNATLQPRIRIEMKAVDADSEEQAARFSVRRSLIEGEKDVVVLVGWKWREETLDNGTACEYPEIFSYVVVPSDHLAQERDQSVALRGGRVDADRILVPKKGGLGVLTEDKGNAGKILRLVHQTRKAEPFDLSQHIQRYLQFAEAVSGRVQSKTTSKRKRVLSMNNQQPQDVRNLETSDFVAEERRRYLASQHDFNNALWSVCDVLRRSHCAGVMQYIPELTWILFLRILDEREQEEALLAQERGERFLPSLQSPFRWQDWASPTGPQRRLWQNEQPGAVLNFVNKSLMPHLQSLALQHDATARQRIISEIFSGIEKSRISNDADLLDVLNKVHAIEINLINPTHVFALSQVYEGLLLRMGEKANDGGQFFTPREIIRVMTKVIAPQAGEAIYDPCCGTGGFLVQAYEQMRENLDGGSTATEQQQLKQTAFYGREKENLIYPIALANLILHGIDEPHVWHGNTLTAEAVNGGLFQKQEQCYDVILTNPPFGGKERKEVGQQFAHKTSATQILFLQHVIDRLKPGGRCGIVLDEGVLFRTNQSAFLQTKKMLLDLCDLWCIVSLPEGVFMAAGALVKTNILFFTKGQPTRQTWYYDLSEIKVGKKTPLTRDKFNDFFRLLPSRSDSDKSWSVSRQEMEARCYDLKAVNPATKNSHDCRSRRELLDAMQSNQQQIDQIIEALCQESLEI